MKKLEGFRPRHVTTAALVLLLIGGIPEKSNAESLTECGLSPGSQKVLALKENIELRAKLNLLIGIVEVEFSCYMRNHETPEQQEQTTDFLKNTDWKNGNLTPPERKRVISFFMKRERLIFDTLPPELTDIAIKILNDPSYGIPPNLNNRHSKTLHRLKYLVYFKQRLKDFLDIARSRKMTQEQLQIPDVLRNKEYTKKEAGEIRTLTELFAENIADKSAVWSLAKGLFPSDEEIGRALQKRLGSAQKNEKGLLEDATELAFYLGTIEENIRNESSSATPEFKRGIQDLEAEFSEK